MGFWSWIQGKTTEKRTVSGEMSGVAYPNPWLLEAFGAESTATGVRVSPETAMRTTAVYCAVKILAEGVASLPLVVYRRRDTKGKDPAYDHHVYRLLHDEPNPEQTSFAWREYMQASLGLRGNGYAHIQRDRGGRPMALWTLPADRTRAFRRNRELKYETYGSDGKRVELDSDDVLHVPGLAFGGDGLNGLSPIGMAREAVALAVVAERHGSTFFANASRPSGALECPTEMPEPARQRLIDSFKEMTLGKNTYRTVLLEEGVTWKPMAIPNEDAQFLETRKFQISEIARLYRIPPHMLADLEHATFTNIEQQSIDFVVNTLVPWFVRWEQELNRKLFGPIERGRYFVKFNAGGLLRGDIQSRYEAYAVGRQWGWLSVNDVRELEDMNPVDGGDEYLTPMNMQPLGAEVNSPDSQPVDSTSSQQVESNSTSQKSRILVP